MAEFWINPKTNSALDADTRVKPAYDVCVKCSDFPLPSSFDTLRMRREVYKT